MKTIDKVCLRCDWEGETSARVCPTCGTELWLPNRPRDERARRGPLAWWRGRRRARGPEAAVAAAAPEVAPIETAPLPSHPEIAREGSPEEVGGPRERRGAFITAAAVLVAALVAIGFLRAGAPAAVDPAARAVGGRLVYAITDDADPQFWRIWIYDLSAGTYTRGPQLAEPRWLARATEVSPDAIASVSERDDGESADLLRFLGPDDEAVSMIQGDHVAWAPYGETAVAATHRGGCDGFEVTAWDPVLARETRRSVPESCADLSSVVATTLYDYLSISEDDRSSVVQIVDGPSVPLEEGYTAIGASGRDLYVVPSSVGPDGPVLEVLTGTPPNGSIHRVGGPQDPFIFERLLSWGAGPAGDLVLGTYGGVRGVYQIPEYRDGNAVRPVLTFETLARDVGATATLDGSVVVSVDGRLFVVRDEAVTEMALPDDAPAPGPMILWLPPEEAPEPSASVAPSLASQVVP